MKKPLSNIDPKMPYVFKVQPWQQTILDAMKSAKPMVRLVRRHDVSPVTTLAMARMAEKYLNHVFRERGEDLLAGAGPGFREMVREELLK